MPRPKQRKTPPKSQRTKRQDATTQHAGETLWRAAFIAALAVHGNVTVAADQAGINRTTAYRVRNEDESFKAQWDSAIEEAADRIEYAAYARAVDGLEKGVYYKGDKVAVEREYSDTLMGMMLKGHKPDKYADKLIIKIKPEQAAILERFGLSAGDAFEQLINNLVEAERSKND